MRTSKTDKITERFLLHKKEAKKDFNALLLYFREMYYLLEEIEEDFDDYVIHSYANEELGRIISDMKFCRSGIVRILEYTVNLKEKIRDYGKEDF